MDNFLIEVYKYGRLKLQQHDGFTWFPAKYLRESEGMLLSSWEEQYARMLVERSDDGNIVGIIKNKTEFTIINLERFLRPIRR
jgi:hypothetical protein